MPSPSVDERRFRAMGTTAHVVLIGAAHGAALARHAEQRLLQLEARWSRFRPDSELSVLNAAGGRACLVSGDTATLVEAMRRAWELTAGRFDATVHDAMGAIGYGSSWPQLTPPVRLPAPTPAPGCAGVEVQTDRGLVRLPVGARLDPGGLGKGLAADLVAAELLDEGAEGALVNVGGDLRVVGRPPEGDAWCVGIDDPDVPQRAVAFVDLLDGGIATSTSRRRRWRTGDGTEAHHLVDPATGLPAVRSWSQVSIVSGAAWWAEVLTKVVFLEGDLPAGETGAGALVLGADGSPRVLGRPGCFSLAYEGAS